MIARCAYNYIKNTPVLLLTEVLLVKLTKIGLYPPSRPFFRY